DAADDEGGEQPVGEESGTAADPGAAGGDAATADPLGDAECEGGGHRSAPVVRARARRRTARGRGESPVATRREMRKLIRPIPMMSRKRRIATADASP